MKRHVRHAAPAVLLLVLACATADEAADANHIANAPELVADEVVRVGSVDDPDTGFSRIGGVAVDGEGAAYVLESQDREIRVYDETGLHIRTFGREGAAPGEFRSPTLIGFRHDTLAVRDAGLGRVTLFDRTGRVLETLSVPPAWLDVAPGVMVMVEPARFRRDGFATTVTRRMVPRELPHGSFSVPQVALDRSGRITDTLRFDRWELSDPRISAGGVDVRVPGGPPATPLRMDGEYDTYTVDRSVATAEDQASITVTRVAGSGDTIYHQAIRYRPMAFPAALVDSIIARAVRPHLRSQQADSGAVDSALRSALSLPQFQPPVRNGRVGADGVLWLQLHEDGTDKQQWLLLEPDGSIRGIVRLPSTVTIHWSSGDRAWAVVRDDFDVPWLVRYDVRRVTRGEQSASLDEFMDARRRPQRIADRSPSPCNSDRCRG